MRDTPHRYLCSSCDEEPDTLCAFKRPGQATDSEITDDEIVIPCEGDEVISLTILHASRR